MISWDDIFKNADKNYQIIKLKEEVSDLKHRIREISDENIRLREKLDRLEKYSHLLHRISEGI